MYYVKTPYQGSLVLSPFPGGGDTKIYADIAEQYATTAMIDRVLTLVTEKEWKELRGDQLVQELTLRNISWVHAPIKDFGIPDQDWFDNWHHVTKQVQHSLEIGKNVLVHCMAGCGRTGLVSVLLMIDMGMTADQAIAHIRSARPCAMETPEQEQCVFRYEKEKTILG